MVGFGDASNRAAVAEEADEREVLVDEELASGDGCARDGYGRTGGPWGGLVSAEAR